MKHYILFLSVVLGTLHSNAIINGKPISEVIYPGVVYFSTAVSGISQGRCTASFVSNDTLLTAKHCILSMVSYCLKSGQCNTSLSISRDGFAIHFPEKIAAGISLDRYPTARVKKIIVSANPKPQLKSYDDLAFIVLDTALPQVTSYPIALESNKKLYMTSVGYGNNSTFVNTIENKINIMNHGAGTKRWSKAPVRSFVHEAGIIHLMAATELKELEDNTLTLNLLEFFGISYGDSGGPLFRSDSKIIGVASQIIHATEQTDEEFYYFSVYTDLTTQYSQLFLEAAEDLGANFRVE